MNFLAHNFLSFQQPGLIVGNYLGDFIRNQEVKLLPDSIKNGVILHRTIDSYTDAHQVVKKATRLLHPTLGKYAPVAVDIYFDFLLTKRWSEFTSQSLSEYCEISYESLLASESVMSEKLANRMRKMVDDRWLENYATYEGLRRIFSFLSRRTKFRSNLENAPAILEPLESQMEEIFMDFFPDIIQYIKWKIEDLI